MDYGKHDVQVTERYKAAREYAEKFMQDNGIASAGAITKKNQEDFRGMAGTYTEKQR